MARYTDSVCKLCRREKQKLFLKGQKCYTDKCPVEQRNYPPGQHGVSRRAKVSEYGIQLREKQKIKRSYGLLETQFRNYFEKAARSPILVAVDFPMNRSIEQLHLNQHSIRAQMLSTNQFLTHWPDGSIRENL